MKDIIKKIRQYLNLSQKEMAKELNVDFVTINRWENGHTIPTPLAQQKLLEVCYQHDIPIFESIVKNIENIVESVKTNDKLILYHGSKGGISGPIMPISRDKCDFGKGFYMGNNIEQTLTLISDFEESKFYILSIDLKGLITLEIPNDIDWAMLIAFHRKRMEKIKGTSFYEKYKNMMLGVDLIIGAIADDKIFHVLDSFFQENITDVALIKSLLVLELGKQFVAISEKACRAIRIEKEINLSYFERKMIQKESELNKKRSTELSDMTIKDYRREGLYFDEIIEKIQKEEK